MSPLSIRRCLPALLVLGTLLPFAWACSEDGAQGGAEAPDSTPAPLAGQGEEGGAPQAASASSPRSAERPLRAAFLVVDGVYNTELVAPFDVFQHVQYQEGGGSGIEVFTVSPDGEPVTTFEGLRLAPDYSFESHPEVDILVVPSAEGSRDKDRANRALVDWVRRVGGQARYTVSLCWGAFVLAEAGLLDGKAATTFPGDYKLFAQTFPTVQTRVNVSFVQDGSVLTSQGGVRSFDVAMHLVEVLYGREVAQGIGGGLLIPWPPEGHHTPPFDIRPVLQPPR